MSAYYNEMDPHAAQWLRNLIKAGQIAAGDVDERSIVDVRPDDLRGYTQCHFFAGIGVWSHALRLAGWSDDRPVWTGSCPCQPFSSAGAGKGIDDPRHLWPVWVDLIRQCRPATVFGEQVEAAIKHGWLDLVQGDLENTGYAVGAVCLPAGAVGAPHQRQRLWFVAHTDMQRRSGECVQQEPQRTHLETDRPGQAGDFWADADWLYCRDEKWRPTEPGTFPLVDGTAFRMGSGCADWEGKSRAGMLKAYGNAIVPQVAAAVIGAFMEYAP